MNLDESYEIIKMNAKKYKKSFYFDIKPLPEKKVSVDFEEIVDNSVHKIKNNYFVPELSLYENFKPVKKGLQKLVDQTTKQILNNELDERTRKKDGLYVRFAADYCRDVKSKVYHTHQVKLESPNIKKLKKNFDKELGAYFFSFNDMVYTKFGGIIFVPVFKGDNNNLREQALEYISKKEVIGFQTKSNEDFEHYPYYEVLDSLFDHTVYVRPLVRK